MRDSADWIWQAAVVSSPEDAGLRFQSFRPMGTSVPPAYVNTFTVVSSPWDVSMVLGRSHAEVIDPATGQPMPQPGAVHEPVANILMSPVHAKALLSVLRQNVEAYEAQFGPIPEIDLTAGAPQNEAT